MLQPDIKVLEAKLAFSPTKTDQGLRLASDQFSIAISKYISSVPLASFIPVT
jgi:hypothetical protein